MKPDRLSRFAIKIGVAIFASFVAFGCGSPTPSEADAKDYFASEGKEKCGGLYEVTSFRKTDGAQPSDNQYVLEFEADVNCLSVEPANQFSGLVGCWHAVGNFHCSSLGQKHVTGHIRFFKSEKGWNPTKV